VRFGLGDTEMPNSPQQGGGRDSPEGWETPSILRASNLVQAFVDLVSKDDRFTAPILDYRWTTVSSRDSP